MNIKYNTVIINKEKTKFLEQTQENDGGFIMVVNMKNYEELSEEELQSELNKYLEEGNATFNDEKARTKLLNKVSKLCKRLANLPMIGSYIERVGISCELIEDVAAGNYKVPICTVVTLIGGLIYLVSPIDLISDLIPILGYMDDAAVLHQVFNTVEKDLNDYIAWKSQILLTGGNE